jgi:hypothetical protein
MKSLVISVKHARYMLGALSAVMFTSATATSL